MNEMNANAVETKEPENATASTPPKIIAVDFDGCLAVNKWPESNSAIVPHKLITSAFLRPNCLIVAFGIKRNSIFWNFNNFLGILYCAAINTSAFTLSGWSIA